MYTETDTGSSASQATATQANGSMEAPDLNRVPNPLYQNVEAVEEESVNRQAASNVTPPPTAPENKTLTEKEAGRGKTLLLISVLACVCGLAGGLGGGAIMSAITSSSQSGIEQTSMSQGGPSGNASGQDGASADGQGQQNGDGASSDSTSSGDSDAATNGSSTQGGQSVSGNAAPTPPDGGSANGGVNDSFSSSGSSNSSTSDSGNSSNDSSATSSTTSTTSLNA